MQSKTSRQQLMMWHKKGEKNERQVMNLKLLSKAIERILSSRYDVEVSVDVRSESKENESAGCSEADKALPLC